MAGILLLNLIFIGQGGSYTPIHQETPGNDLLVFRKEGGRERS